MSTSTWTTVKDKMKAGFKFDNIDKAVTKATNHDKTAPKEKHVQTLIQASKPMSGVSPQDLIKALSKPLKSKDWIVALKGLITIHRLLIANAAGFITHLQMDVKILHLKSFNDIVNDHGFNQSVFVREYSLYLEEWLHFSRMLRHRSFEDIPTLQLTDVQTSSLIDGMITLLFSFSEMTFNDTVINNITTLTAFGLLLKDSFIVYRSLTARILDLIDHFFDVSREIATGWVEIYKRYIRLHEQLGGVYRYASTCHGIHSDAIPVLKPLPGSVLQSMYEHLGQTPPESNGSSFRNPPARNRSSSSFKGKPVENDSAEEYSNIVKGSLSDLLQTQRSTSQKAAQPNNTMSLDNLLDFNPIAEAPKQTTMQQAPITGNFPVNNGTVFNNATYAQPTTVYNPSQQYSAMPNYSGFAQPNAMFTQNVPANNMVSPNMGFDEYGYTRHHSMVMPQPFNTSPYPGQNVGNNGSFHSNPYTNSNNQFTPRSTANPMLYNNGNSFPNNEFQNSNTQPKTVASIDDLIF